MSAPDLTIVVVVHDMAREAPRTLLSLAPLYQLGVAAEDYEVVVVDNGSQPPLGADTATAAAPNVRYHYVADASPSPAAALNLGAQLAQGRWLGLMVDGARMVTPGMLRAAREALGDRDDLVVETMGFHLGHQPHHRAAPDSYGPQEEDELLASIGWPEDGYRLFDIASLAGSCHRGWYAPISESTCLFMSAAAFERHGGFDERFDEPGGGFLNLDFYRRVMEDPALVPVRLVGEATFHQVHGGAATGRRGLALRAGLWRWRRQYRRIRGRRYRAPEAVPELVGAAEPHAQRWMERSAELYPPPRS